MDENFEVLFDVYCGSCKHWDKPGFFEPCNECLGNPVNSNSHKPIYYEEKQGE